MALSLDGKIDQVRVKQFASQIQYVSPRTRSWFEETFSGEHSIEFYEGLLSAYTFIYQTADGFPPEEMRNLSGQLVAFVASELQKKYDSQKSAENENKR